MTKQEARAIALDFVARAIGSALAGETDPEEYGLSEVDWDDFYYKVLPEVDRIQYQLGERGDKLKASAKHKREQA